MSAAPRRYTAAFLLGCVEPDKNPTTYLKGSLRSQWLRGHNWSNSQRYMGRVCTRLERRAKLRLLDYYTLGKLIHYTTDAFTCAHNDFFGDDLKAHCSYEKLLQVYFAHYLDAAHHNELPHSSSAMETIHAYHRDYSATPQGIHTDSWYSIHVSAAVLALLLADRTSRAAAPACD